MVGREKELAFLHRWLDRVTSTGASHTVLMEGEAGIGKSRVVAEVTAAAHDSGIEVRSGSAHEFERTRPFGTIADALGLVPSSSDPERARITGLLLGEVRPSGTSWADGPNVQFLVSEAIVGLVEEMATAGPLMVVLEDMHWADPSTLGMVATLARRLVHLPLAMLVTFRPVPRPRELERLLDVAGAAESTNMRLGPLPDEAVVALVLSVTGATSAPALLAELAKAEGNPLYVLALLAALRDEGALEVLRGHVDATCPALPRDLRVTLLRRLTYLDAETLDVLRAASVLGSSFDVSHLALLLGRSAMDLARWLKTALDAGILREDGERLAFRHELVREAIYEELPVGVRSTMHAQVSRDLAAAGAPAREVAGHLRLGARAGDREAVRWLHTAGSNALRRDPTIAAELLEQSLELADRDDPARDEILADLAQARLWTGHVVEAQALARQVLGRAHDPSAAPQLWTALVLALLAQARTGEAHDECQRALAGSEVAGPMRAQLQACAAHARAFVGDLDGAAAAANEAQITGEREGDDLAVCMALSACAHAASNRGDLTSALSAASEAANRASRTPEAGRFHSHLFLANALGEMDLLADAHAAIRDGRRLSEELGTAWNLPMYHFGLAWFRYFSGHWDDAVAEVEAGFSVASDVGTRHGTVSGAAVLAFVDLHRNDLRAAEEALVQGRAEFTSGYQHRSDWLYWAGGLLEEARGCTALALVALEKAWSLCTVMGVVSEYPLLGPDLVRLCMVEAQFRRASQVASEVEDVAASMGTPWAEAAALRCRGMADTDTCVLEQAVAAARGSPRPLPLAAACEEAGELLARVGRRSEAVPLLEEAAAGYQSLGAVRHAARAEATLRSIGVRRGQRGSRPRRPATGWDALTPTEVEVAHLVAHGATNRQAAQQLYKSARTVETHVSRVLAKLGVSSRSELAGFVLRRESAGRSPSPPPPPTTTAEAAG